MRHVAALTLVIAGAGCAYYNGMYNANRLVREAEKAEREGRAFQSDGLWAQAAVRAESVLVRHPGSKWADDAMLLRGKAYKKRNDCPSAIPSLQDAIFSSRDSALVTEAALLLGECYVEVGNYVAADAALRRAYGAEDSLVLSRVRRTHAKTLTLAGSYGEALALYRDVEDSTADGIRLLALAGGGSLAHAAALADSLLVRRDSTVPWDSVLAVTGRRDPEAASALTDRLLREPELQPQIRARWLFGDGMRLAQIDTVRATQRLQAASGVGDQRTPSGSQARLMLARLALAQVGEVGQLEALQPMLVEFQELGGAGGFEAGRLLAAVERVRQTADSVGPDTPQGDLEWFLAAETARDLLQAPALASGLFLRLAQTWPSSPYAAKALLAVADLQPALAPALRQLLISGYGQSPYVAAISGTDDPSYRVLEDSLRSFTASRVGPRPDRTRPEQPDRPRPDQDRRLGEDDVQ